jgi:hypothetical protein
LIDFGADPVSLSLIDACEALPLTAEVIVDEVDIRALKCALYDFQSGAPRSTPGELA